ncbi:hypothetical protein N9V98_07565, partial [Luminiphilus sp.]|nr:hypothetical protein [Luminiphilus sp.]
MSKLLAEIAKSKTAAKAAVRKLTLDQLRTAIDNLKIAMDAIEHRESEKRASNLKKIKGMMAEMGISAGDLSQSPTG